MHFTPNKNNTGTLCLDGDLTIDRAAELLEVCCRAVSTSDSISLTFGEVGAVDLTCLQLLCAAHRTAIAQGKQFRFAGKRPEVLSEIAARAGFIRKWKCQMNPEHDDCLWLGGAGDE